MSALRKIEADATETRCDPLFHQRAIRVAAREAGYSEEVLLGEWRWQPLVHARWAVMIAMRRRGVSFPRIGAKLNREHTTVQHGVQSGLRRERWDPEFAELVAKVEAA